MGAGHLPRATKKRPHPEPVEGRTIDLQPLGAAVIGFVARRLLATVPVLAVVAVFVFLMGLMHGETLTPQLVGDSAWRDFVVERVAALIGAAPQPQGSRS